MAKRNRPSPLALALRREAKRQVEDVIGPALCDLAEEGHPLDLLADARADLAEAVRLLRSWSDWYDTPLRNQPISPRKETRAFLAKHGEQG